MMARKIKNPVVVTMSRKRAEDLASLLWMNVERLGSRLAKLADSEIDGNVGKWVTLELTRKDALAMHAAALADVQVIGTKFHKLLTKRAYLEIERAFRDAYDARLRAMSGK